MPYLGNLSNRRIETKVLHRCSVPSGEVEASRRIRANLVVNAEVIGNRGASTEICSERKSSISLGLHLCFSF